MHTRNYLVKLTGVTPLLMHWDNLEWADRMDQWKNSRKKGDASKAGDDRSPAWRWLGCLYHDGSRVAIPADNLMRCLMEGGAGVPVPGGKNGKTFKAQTQSGCVVAAPFWPIVVQGKEIPVAELLALEEEPDFSTHNRVASMHGFMLFLKRAKIGAAKHVRVRPRFDLWAAEGIITVWDDAITQDVLLDILTYAGQYKGLMDWRPGGRTPGPFGRFSVEVSDAK